MMKNGKVEYLSRLVEGNCEMIKKMADLWYGATEWETEGADIYPVQITTVILTALQINKELEGKLTNKVIEACEHFFWNLTDALYPNSREVSKLKLEKMTTTANLLEVLEDQIRTQYGIVLEMKLYSGGPGYCYVSEREEQSKLIQRIKREIARVRAL